MSTARPDEPPTAVTTSIYLAEFQALRAEILDRSNGQRQVLSLAIIAVGTLFAASVQSANAEQSALLLLGYPILALFLASGWGHHDRRIVQIGRYIHSHIEEALGKDANGQYYLGWEHHPLPGALEYVTARGIFVGTQLFAIVVSATYARVDVLAGAVVDGRVLPATNPVTMGLLAVSLLSVVLTIPASQRQPRDGHGDGKARRA
jgi:hypothetical protein